MSQQKDHVRNLPTCCKTKFIFRKIFKQKKITLQQKEALFMVYNLQQ